MAGCWDQSRGAGSAADATPGHSPPTASENKAETVDNLEQGLEKHKWPFFWGSSIAINSSYGQDLIALGTTWQITEVRVKQPSKATDAARQKGRAERD